MSFKVVNGKNIEILDESFSEDELSPVTNELNYGFNPGFFEPKPISPNGKQSYSKFVFGKRNSILGKRKAEEAFGEGINDEDRYGQTINDDYFNNLHGHGVKFEINEQKNNIPDTKLNENFDFEFIPTPEQIEVLNWLERYRENKRNGKELFDMYN